MSFSGVLVITDAGDSEVDLRCEAPRFINSLIPTVSRLSVASCGRWCGVDCDARAESNGASKVKGRRGCSLFHGSVRAAQPLLLHEVIRFLFLAALR